MSVFKAILLISALLTVTQNAYAASAQRSCFETAADAQQFAANLKAYEVSYHEAETKRRELIGASGQSYESLRYILGSNPNVSHSNSENYEKPSQSVVTQKTAHKHLIASEVRLNDASEYCIITHSEIQTFLDIWTVDISKNLVLNANTITEITR